jgi:hypothetical protein
MQIEQLCSLFQPGETGYPLQPRQRRAGLRVPPVTSLGQGRLATPCNLQKTPGHTYAWTRNGYKQVAEGVQFIWPSDAVNDNLSGLSSVGHACSAD